MFSSRMGRITAEKRLRMSIMGRNGRTGVGVILLLAVVACGPATRDMVASASNTQALTTIAVVPTTQPSTAMLWGRLPYCNCFAESATVNVANALKEAKLTVNLQELSPRNGWLYFAVTFDPTTATGDQVVAAMKAGGAEVLDSPP